MRREQRRGAASDDAAADAGVDEPRRRRSRIRTLVILALCVAVLATAALLIAQSLLARSSVRRWLAATASRELTSALHQPIEIGDVAVAMYPPRVSLRAVRVGPADHPLASIRVIEVVPGQIRMTDRELVISQVRVAGVTIEGTLPSAATEPTPAQNPWIHVIIRQLEVTEVRVPRLEISDGLVIHVKDLEARWSGSSRNPIQAAVVDVVGVTLEAPGIEPVSGSVQAWGRRRGEGWEISRLRASGSGWRVDAAGAGAGTTADLHGSLEADLAALDTTLRIHAGLLGAVHARWKASFEAGRFAVDSTIDARRVEAVGFLIEALKGESHVDNDGIEATIDDARFAGGEVEGTYRLDGFAAPWRHRVVLRGRRVDLGAFLRQIRVPDAGLSGTCGMSAEVAWDGEQIKAGSGTAVVDIAPTEGPVAVSGRVTVALRRDGLLHLDTDNTTLAESPISWRGTIALGSWEPVWEIQADAAPIPVVAHLLEGWVGTSVLPAELDGVAALDVGLHGPFTDLTVIGDIAAAPIRYGAIDGDSLEGSFQYRSGVFSFHDSRVRIGRGSIETEGAITVADRPTVELRARGRNLPLARIAAWITSGAPLAGRLDVTGDVSGELAAPTVKADVQLRQVTLAGVLLGDGSGRAVLDHEVLHVSDLAVGPFASSLELDLNARRTVVAAKLDNFDLSAVSPVLARLAGGPISFSLKGDFPFDDPSGRLDVVGAGGVTGSVVLGSGGIAVELGRQDVWTVRGTVARQGAAERGDFSISVPSLGRLASDLTGEEVPVTGRAEGTATVISTPGQPIELTTRVTTLEASVNGDSVALQRPLDVKLRGSALSVGQLILAGPTSRLEGEYAQSEDGTINGRVVGQVPVSLVGLLWPEARLGGVAAVTVTVSGTYDHPSFSGSAKVQDGSVLLPGFPMPLTHVAGVFNFVPEALRLEGVTFSLGSGHGTGEGRIVLTPRIELDLSTRVEDLRWPVMTGFDPRISGTIRIAGSLDALAVSGDTVLQHTVFREDLNLQRLVLQLILAPQRTTASSTGAVALNIVVAVPSSLEVDTPLARMVMRGRVRLVGTSVQPGLVGQLEMLPGGEVEFSGQRYDLSRGVLTFSNADRINPYLDVVAHATVQSVEITISLLGTLDRLTPTLASNPPLPETDILALLSTGRRASQTSQSMAGAIAGSFLTEQLAGAVTRRARTLLDLDQLRVDPFATSETGSPTARVTVVKRLSSDWTVTVSSNLATNREEVIQSRWRINPELFLQASRDIDGSYSLEFRWQRRY